ncbi:hypothetical protein HM1_1012 [Heliomicrobium modesticaldum Ice1]|uniref:Uncharacterized protein n=1 Tax=Heliobacterium modesticaldum (strain ATCC 51547 / Ice1) TaxID=498761 RepID=B0TIE2_HELMI|nr:Wadjet anti-phage system protein JetA family protein [Heliomicrobium modesticaldum]ABZ83562.1 hypothetical protein HM1_1012 [Heliomicrobium modesticaldum Ice1]
MKLFDILPDKFFLLFSGKNRPIFAEAVFLVYQQYQITRFGIAMDVLRDLMQELVESQEEQGFVFDVEEEQEAPGGQAPFDDDMFRMKANAILRRLDRLGWIQIETRENFRQYVVLPFYTSRILAVLKEICEERVVEYQRFAFLTYQLLTGEEIKHRPGLAVLEAEKITQQFQEELNILVNNIKHHMEQVAQKSSISDVLNHHFDEYKAKIVDRSYHRLKTSDHVSRYRQRILETVQQSLWDKDWFERAIEDGLRSEFFSDREEGEQRLRGALLFIEEAYRGLDDVFYQIDLRHNQYLRASYDRARYLSQHSHGMDQQLAGLLEWLGKEADDAAAEAALSRLFRLLRLRHLTEDSLFTPRRKRAPHQPEARVIVEIPEELKRELREKDLARMRRAITRDKVKAFVLEHMGARKEIGIEELAPTTVEEFLYLVYTYLYGYDGKAGYRLIRGKENRVIEMGDYRFYDRRVIR